MIRTRIDSGILIVEIGSPPVNALSKPVRADLLAAIGGRGTAKGVVITGAGVNFVGGADLKEMSAPPADPILPDVLQAIETAPIPVVAAINGAALGGGLELALACHARIASPPVKLGLPEVKLGIVPGAGGTQRLPRLIGVGPAAEMIVSGRAVSGDEALKLGLVDAVAADVAAEAIATARRLAQAGNWRRTGDLVAAPGDADAASAALVKKARGIQAAAEAVRLVKLSTTTSLEEALADERATFLRLRESDEAKALRHLFFAERAAAKIEGLADVVPMPVATLGVVGLGLMGAGIATAALNAGVAVVGVESTLEAAAAGTARVRDLLDRAAKSGRLTEAEAAERLARIEISPDFAALARADLVIEAVPDDPVLKRHVFAQIATVVSERTIIATNTSYLDPDTLLEALPRPSRCAGLHFFSPAHIMRLVEVVRCAGTSPATLATALAFAKKLGKLPVVCKATEGFVGNRVFSSYRQACEYLIEDGASPLEVDAAMENFGMAMGPFKVFDLAGLEIAWVRRKRQAATRDPSLRYVPVADWLCEQGRFGRKTGKGWYDYASGEAKDDPAVMALIAKASLLRGIARRAVPAEEIVSRLTAAMACEGDKLLAEGIVPRASDIDLVLVNGYGFPAWRGGPMFMARHEAEAP